MEGPDVLRLYSERDNAVFQEDFTDVLDSVYAYVSHLPSFSSSSLSLFTPSSTAVSCIASSLSGLCTIPTRRAHSLPSSEESTPWEDMPQDNNDASHASSVRLLVLLEPSPSKASLVRMVQEEQPATISIWLSAFTAGTANRHAQWTQSCKDQTTKTQPSTTRSYFTTNKSY